jgi:hypothetical protein
MRSYIIDLLYDYENVHLRRLDIRLASSIYSSYVSTVRKPIDKRPRGRNQTCSLVLQRVGCVHTP